MASIQWDTRQVTALAGGLARAPATTRTRVARDVQDTGRAITADAKLFAPELTGALRASIRMDSRDGGLESEVSANTSYADYVEQGTSKMAPEPYMAPSGDRHLPGLPDKIGRSGSDFL